MTNTEIIKWLLNGDISIQYQVYRDLYSIERNDLQKRIESEGWGKEFISKRGLDGHWGLKFYQPKWISTHYTLLDLRYLCIYPDNLIIKETLDNVLSVEKGADKGINPSTTIEESDVCLNGMFLNYASYFKSDEDKLKSIVDFIISQHMDDGGFNCMKNRSGARHASLHSTLSVLEGIYEFRKNGYSYKIEELLKIEKSAREFILKHNLYLSDRTGQIIRKDFLKLSYPGRWRYDILKALDYFQYSGTEWDERMSQAINVLLNKKNKNNTWSLQAKHPGQVHFEMEQAGKASRMNTLRVLRVLKYYKH